MGFEPPLPMLMLMLLVLRPPSGRLGAAEPVAATCHNPFKVGTALSKGSSPILGVSGSVSRATSERPVCPPHLSSQLPGAGPVRQTVVPMAAGATGGGRPRAASRHAEPPSRPHADQHPLGHWRTVCLTPQPVRRCQTAQRSAVPARAGRNAAIPSLRTKEKRAAFHSML